MNKEDKFIVTDATDIICIGGFGNDLGNIGLLKYNEQEIANMMIENNTKVDDIRLANSLLNTIKKQKEVIDRLNFIKNRKNQGASQENINKMAIEFVNSYLKEVE